MREDQDRVVAASVTVPARVESVRPAAAFLVAVARSTGVALAGHDLFEVAIVEALSNAVTHTPRDADGNLHCDLELSSHSLVIRVLDGAAVAPVALSVPSGAIPWSDATSDSWETIPETGYGLYLMRAVFSDITPVTRDGKHGIELRATF